MGKTILRTNPKSSKEKKAPRSAYTLLGKYPKLTDTKTLSKEKQANIDKENQ